ncbi:DUF2243 domain-containing protein [Blastococcus saxobsidens]|uniref:DUF2243 domain-containing protein n=1 Tax=Blastococcus saxobsidens (strain DD2) TaxID=1146883 RepID=H6RIU8_BLASD|nr:DUF2243 domain-containing protein [Blastococcus saxobsidens]CCG03490.1 protein of unknown function [Blastococcus saxobsidens DD2]
MTTAPGTTPSAARKPTRSSGLLYGLGFSGFVFGLVLAGWGLYDLVEGLIDHQILGAHHVRDDLGSPLGRDLGFLALGAVLLVGGRFLHRRGVRRLASTARLRRT